MYLLRLLLGLWFGFVATTDALDFTCLIFLETKCLWLTLDGMTYRIPVYGRTSGKTVPLQKSAFQLPSFYEILHLLRGNKIIWIGEKN